MQAVIPAAGEGTRLGPLTADRPQALLPVAGEPLLAHCLRSLSPLELTGAVVVVREPDGPVARRFGDGFEGLPLRYARQARPEGLADAVLSAAPFLDGDPFVVLNGDNVLRGNVREAAERRRREGLDALLVVEEVPPERAHQGVCRTDGRGRLIRMVEYPDEEDRRAGLINTGFGVYSPALLDACRAVEPSEAGEREITDAVNLLLEWDRPVGILRLRGWRVNVNTPGDLLEAEDRIVGLPGASRGSHPGFAGAPTTTGPPPRTRDDAGTDPPPALERPWRT